MEIQWIRPARDLSHIVKCFWWMNCGVAEAGREMKMVSDAYPELLFHLGATPLVHFAGAEEPFAWEQCATGIFLRHVRIVLRGPVQMFFVKLQPWALGKMLGVKAREVLNRQVDLSELEGMEEAKFSGELLACSGVAGVVGQMENWIRRKMGEWWPDRALVGVVRTIVKEQGQGQIGDLEGRFMLGRRRLEQLFKEQVGISPKAFARIIRIRSVCQAMTRQHPARLAHLALEHGFFDQSHFHREVKYFLDMTPRACIAALQGKSSVYELVT